MTLSDLSRPSDSSEPVRDQRQGRSHGHAHGQDSAHDPAHGHTHDLAQDAAHDPSDRHHHHVHSEESQRLIVNRLSRIEGHIRGIKTMVQDGRDCPDVLVQVAAVRGALDRVARVILDEHLTECIGRAAKEGNIGEEIEALKAALDRFLP